MVRLVVVCRFPHRVEEHLPRALSCHSLQCQPCHVKGRISVWESHDWHLCCGHLHLDSRPRSGFRAGQPDEKARRHRPNGGLACLEVLTVVICSVLPEMVFLAVDGLGRSGGYCPYNRHVNEECEAELRLWREVGSYVTLSMTLPLALV